MKAQIDVLLGERNSSSGWLRADRQGLGDFLSPHSGKERRPFLGDVSTTAAPIKYLHRAAAIIEDVRPWLPSFEGLHCGYELGVGPGFLMRMLIDVMGIAMRGCDVDVGELVHDDIRRCLGLADFVEEFPVRPRVTTPLPASTDFVVATGSVFDKFGGTGPNATWSIEDYEWFLRDLATQPSIPKCMIWRFNRWWGAPEHRGLRDYFERIGSFPLPKDFRFCVIELAQFRPAA